MINNKKFLTLDDYSESIHGGDLTKRQDIYDDDYDVGLSINIMNARRAYGFTQLALAKSLGTKQPNIARFESGAALPSHDMIKKIARILGLRPVAPSFEEEPATSGATIIPFSFNTQIACFSSIDLRSYSSENKYVYAS